MQHDFEQGIKRNINASNELLVLCAELFRTTPITWFGYSRFDKNRDLIFLSTCPELYRFYVDNKFHIAEFAHRDFDEMVSGSFFCKLLESTDEEARLTELMQDQFGLSNFVNIIEKHDEYCDIYNFSSSIHADSLPNFYLNNIAFLHQYVKMIQPGVLEIIDRNELQPLAIPARHIHQKEGSCPEFEGSPVTKKRHLRGLSLDDEGKVENRLANIALLSKREKECLTYIVRGYTSRQIAEKINLSFRTVENYTERVKVKLKCSRKEDLIRKYVGML